MPDSQNMARLTKTLVRGLAARREKRQPWKETSR
jgi:hypothetical protein